MNEKIKIIIHRIIWIYINVIIIFIPIINYLSQPKVEIVDSDFEVDYSEYYDVSKCNITIYFNQNIDNGYVTIFFYDAYHNLIDGTKKLFISDGNVLSDDYILANGHVHSMKIVNYTPSSVYKAFGLYGLFIFTIPVLISTFLLSYKEYKYNGKLLSVYAGFYHNTLKINGKIYDEHNTLLNFSSIKLSTPDQDGNKIEVTITLTNRIFVTINDKLVNT